ncbi:MAG: sugar ABC transporter substrate-binding protein [Candidatus Rokuibacteriota bacterium]|nr:MAG: sugar ABC transporter substrate-binding protein [Candidatus Rokubacteria bacterium]
MRRLLLVLWVAVLSGCGGSALERGPVTLVFKYARILGPADPVPELLREFEAAHPNVRVRGEALPWTSDEQHQFYVINLEGRSPGFDVMMLDVIWVPEFARAGWLLDLTPGLHPGELAPYFPSTVEAATDHGRVWALPWNMNVGLLYYRADLLGKYGLAPPETFDELARQVVRIRAGERDPALDGYLWQAKQYEGLVVNVLEAFWANGTRLLADDGTLFPEPGRAAEALGFLRGLIASGVSPAWTPAADEELSRRAFGDGRAVFLRNWPYAMDLFQARDSPVRGRVGIAPLPGFAGGPRGAGSTGGAHLGVSRRSRHPELAVDLARFLTSERAQKAIALGAALSPTREVLYHDPGLVRSRPELPALHALMRAGRSRPVTPYYLLLSSTVQPEFSAVLVGLKAPARAIGDARLRLSHFLDALR